MSKKRKKQRTSEADVEKQAQQSTPSQQQQQQQQQQRNQKEQSSTSSKNDDQESAVASIPALPSGRKFWTSQDDSFSEYLQNHYAGFVHLPVQEYENRIVSQDNFHEFSRRALERLRDANYYQYDVVMAGGKHSSRTFVKRTLVGNPGITYKYLGLRLFAHAWSGPGVSPAMRAIGDMNQHIVQLTKQLENPGRCDYNLTLINYMEPHSHTSIGFKEDSEGLGKVSVSWHSDSSLESLSAIGVYHCLPTQKAAKWDWRIALRPSPDNNAHNGHNQPAPVAINTKDGDIYFLLGDSNEKYQHCVLAGSQANRISSTHRVAVTAEDTYDYILKRVKIARKRFRLQIMGEGGTEARPGRTDAKIIRYCQQVLTEVEMEWVAQYWLQGAQHDKMHVWWQRPMKTLEAYFVALEQYTHQLFQLCLHDSTIPLDVIKVMLKELKQRQLLRIQWNDRRKDKIYQRRITAEYRPVARPLFDPTVDDIDVNTADRLPKDLDAATQALSEVLKKRSSSEKVGDLPNSKQVRSQDANPGTPKRSNVEKAEEENAATRKTGKKKRKKKKQRVQ
ncbi:MAG: hypothetical protein SGILL_000075 [Bacillariaceae sp.]